MDSLHEAGPAGALDVIRQLDVLLNARIGAARCGRALNHRLREKYRIKRRLVRLSDAELGPAALDVLAELQAEARR